METFGSRLRALRRARHLPQEKVAHDAGITVSHYARLEHDKHSPTLDTLTGLAAALDVDLAALGGKSDKTGQDSHSYPHDHDNFPAAS